MRHQQTNLHSWTCRVHTPEHFQLKMESDNVEKAGNLNCLFNSEFPPRSTGWQQNGINSIHIKNSWRSPLLKVYRRFAFSNRSKSCGSDSLQCIHYNILQSCHFGSCILSRESMPFLKHFLNSFDVASGIHEFIKYDI